MTAQGSTLKRVLAATIILSMLLSCIPSVYADDDMASANVAVPGTSYTEWVCNGDGCSHGGDVRDYWKVDAINGDIVEVTVSGQMSNPDNGICTLFGAFADGWEGDVRLKDSAGNDISHSGFDNDGPTSVNLQTPAG
ncbi:MAG: hypothetical protein OSB33_02635, partial [Candidatus Poseidoniales archaeon]|nr:hypothetical protein [Candidatus Poseidoniales archaeon]